MIFRTMFVLAVLNLERSIAFYRDVLGFQIGNAAYPGWKIMERDGAPFICLPFFGNAYR